MYKNLFNFKCTFSIIMYSIIHRKKYKLKVIEGKIYKK